MSSTNRRTNAASFGPDKDDVFGRIADRYDFLCDLFSLGIHRLWKRKMASAIALEQAMVMLDVATGTGDIPYRITSAGVLQEGQRLIVSDICPQMLAEAKQKLRGHDQFVEYRLLDAHDMPEIETVSMDLFSISFAMKICDRRRVMEEAFRILKPGGVFYCLEASRIPFRLVQALYLKYMQLCMPYIGKVATGGDESAYQYLLRGIREFPDAPALARELEATGFERVTFQRLGAGITALHRGVKPDTP